MVTKRYLTRRQVAEYCQEKGLPVTPALLAKMAVRGDGPPYHLALGQAISEIPAVDIWIEETLGPAFRSTSARTVANAHPEYELDPDCQFDSQTIAGSDKGDEVQPWQGRDRNSRDLPVESSSEDGEAT